ncbi:hypothetical protein LCGC14_3084890 [marine sediment metagenome]|uniref:HNH endonuclease n=1 Tax=marine sediment metagenome TaxID=412755 RepID=A0A0F8YJV1_9ZZZZ
MNYKHGHARAGAQTKEYRAWAEMLKRCRNPSFHGYHKYGGRGIKVCSRWIKSFPVFLDEVGLAPTPQHTLDRIDNDGDYKPGNVRFTTNFDNCQNRDNYRYNQRKRGT